MTDKRPLASAARIKLAPLVSPPSLKQTIYETLKEAITAPNIYADDAELRLDERELSARLQISRTPIREALARLEQEGLVRIVPRKGVFIVRKSKQDILEMILVWAALESMAARLVTSVATNEDIASLRTMFATFNNNQIRAQIDEYSETNISFHQRILELARIPLLTEITDGLFIHMQAIRARTISEGDRVNRSIVDHFHIIEALESRDAELAERLVREHSLNLYAHVERTWVESESGVSAA
ncbi:MAG: GntR family transcriptional regulator [Rhizobiales bacterium]|nr:GntR family transcriptional regulator [Hyphomicrobiales bacterium]